jgi:hypothetical protein
MQEIVCKEHADIQEVAESQGKKIFLQHPKLAVNCYLITETHALKPRTEKPTATEIQSQ